MRRILLVLVLLGTGTALLVSGCGGDSEAEEKRLTKRQFVRLTQAFCHRESFAEKREMKEYARDHGLLYGRGNPREEEELVEAVIFDYVRAKIAYFKSLEVPEGDEREVRAMIVAFEEGLEKSEKNIPLLVEPRPGQENPFDESYRTTEAYGPWLCGQI